MLYFYRLLMNSSFMAGYTYAMAVLVAYIGCTGQTCMPVLSTIIGVYGMIVCLLWDSTLRKGVVLGGCDAET